MLGPGGGVSRSEDWGFELRFRYQSLKCTFDLSKAAELVPM